MRRKFESVAIIGLGSIGRRHLRVLRKLRPNLKIVTVRSKSGKPCPEDEITDHRVETVQEAIDFGIDAAIIANPASLHVEHLNLLIKAGVSCLVEKPLAESLASARKVVSSAPVPVLVGYVLRHDPSANKFFELLKSGRIGNLIHARIECGSFLPSWRPDSDFMHSVSANKNLGGGALLELSHELDYAIWFFGAIRSVYAVTPSRKVFDVEVEEMVEAILETENGFISMNINFNSALAKRECRAIGSKGTLVWDGIERTVTSFGNDGSKEKFEFAIERDTIFENQLVNFERCVSLGMAPKVSLDDGIQVMKVVEMIRRSLEIGQKVDCDE